LTKNKEVYDRLLQQNTGLQEEQKDYMSAFLSTEKLFIANMGKFVDFAL
jgi:hypothetical protein